MADEMQYDVALSFAGEDRDFVRRVAEHLRDQETTVFFDEFEQIDLWGKDLTEALDRIYRVQSQFVVMFVSQAYANKIWTNHEKRSALSRALEEKIEYVLPARFDETTLDGLQSTVAYIDLNRETPEEFGNKILAKLGKLDRDAHAATSPPREGPRHRPAKVAALALFVVISVALLAAYATGMFPASRNAPRTNVDANDESQDDRSDHVQPDLIVGSISQPRWVEDTRVTEIQVRVNNIGTARSGATTVKLIDISTRDEKKGSSFEQEAVIPVLDVNGEHTVTLQFPYWLLNPNAELIAVVDPKNEVYEQDEENNTLERRFIG